MEGEELFQKLAQELAPGRISIAVVVRGGKVCLHLSEKTNLLVIEPDGVDVLILSLKHFADRARKEK